MSSNITLVTVHLVVSEAFKLAGGRCKNTLPVSARVHLSDWNGTEHKAITRRYQLSQGTHTQGDERQSRLESPWVSLPWRRETSNTFLTFCIWEASGHPRLYGFSDIYVTKFSLSTLHNIHIRSEEREGNRVTFIIEGHQSN